MSYKHSRISDFFCYQFSSNAVKNYIESKKSWLSKNTDLPTANVNEMDMHNRTHELCNEYENNTDS